MARFITFALLSLFIATASAQTPEQISFRPDLILSGHTARIHDLAWSPDGAELVTASADSTLRTWNTTDSATLLLLMGQSGEVVSVDWGKIGLIASGSLDNTAWLWDANSDNGAALIALNSHTRDVWGVGWLEDGTLATTGDDMTVQFWSSADFAAPISIQENSAAIYTLDTVANRVATGDLAGNVTLWTSAGVEARINVGFAVNSVSFGPDGGQLAVVGESDEIVLWSIGGGETRITSSQPALYSVALNGSLLAVGGAGGVIELYTAQEGALQTTLTAHTGLVSSLAWSPDGARLASASYDGTAIIWAEQ